MRLHLHVNLLHPLVAWLLPACAVLLVAGRRSSGRKALMPPPDASGGEAASNEEPYVSTSPKKLPGRRLFGGAAAPELRAIGLSRNPDSSRKRTNYIDWHDYFMSVAVLSAFRSKDPNRQVGACIVDPGRRIVGIGYNGFPWGCSDDVLPWARKADSWLDTKYPYVCHAEVNAILNKNAESLVGCSIYVTLFPCNECAKLIIQSRIKEVIYLSDSHKESDAMTASRRMLRLAGVKFWQHTPSANRVVVDFDEAAQ